jgi:WD40 repeat protein
LGTLEGHAGPVWSLAFTWDGRLLVSGSQDRTVKLWDAASGHLLTTLVGHTRGVWGVALSRDGQHVASSSQDGTAILWHAASGSAVRILRSDRRYERVNITDLSGVTEAQRDAMLANGAVDLMREAHRAHR